MFGSLMMLASIFWVSSPKLGQIVGDPLAFGQILGEVGDDPAGQGDVPGFDLDPGALGEGLDDREQGVGGQCGGFVDFGPDDLVSCSCSLLDGYPWIDALRLSGRR